MVPVHDEPIGAVGGDRSRPPAGLDDLPFEFDHPVVIDFFGWDELSRVEKLVLNNARFHSRLPDVMIYENASQIVYGRELTPF
ncbi:hypothetical protein RHSP_09735 [Rhizobium freirei PRF 81]|uniref:Uncharacterized protein n=1 Tax=Rhizobium freirei PRF 81 TaxID=363754 RepID=N6V5W2_9HYPH|nr:hypothetical protein RHSP_09735 [Rhizobium freirei PRF 81]